MEEPVGDLPAEAEPDGPAVGRRRRRAVGPAGAAPPQAHEGRAGPSGDWQGGEQHGGEQHGGGTDAPFSAEDDERLLRDVPPHHGN